MFALTNEKVVKREHQFSSIFSGFLNSVCFPKNVPEFLIPTLTLTLINKTIEYSSSVNSQH